LRPDGSVLFPERPQTVFQEECIRAIRSYCGRPMNVLGNSWNPQLPAEL
jgi:hypothetical protein